MNNKPQIKFKFGPYWDLFSQCYREFQFFGPKSKILGIIRVILCKWPEFGF